ncbi:MAG: bifunctional diguanylate cyclase/phosphodiesterase [Actinomycetales bacterium]
MSASDTRVSSRRLPVQGGQHDGLVAALRQLAVAPPDPDVVLTTLLGAAQQLTGAPSAAVTRLHGAHLVIEASYGAVVDPLGTRLAVDSTVAGVALRERRGQLCLDGWQDGRTDAEVNRRSGVRSSVHAPLLYRDQPLGCVSVLGVEPGMFDEQDVATLEALAEVAASRLSYSFALLEQQQAIESLERTQARLLKAEALTGMATWDWDIATGALTWSDRMFTLLGLEPESMDPTFERFLQHVHPDDRETCARLAEHAQATGEGYQNVFRVVRPDGEVAHLLAWSDPVLGLPERAEGETNAAAPHPFVVGVRGATIDISDRVRATAIATASEERFRTAFDNAPTGMLLVSTAPGREGEISQANQALHVMLGYEPGELVGQTITSISPPEFHDIDLQRMRQLASGMHHRMEFPKQYVRKDGSRIDVLVTTAAGVDVDGSPFVISHALDITDRQRTQRELERMALTDALTGLANRTLLHERVGRALDRLGEEPRGSVALLMMDLDRFKLVNDTLGHQAGDELLQAVAARLRATCPETATIARLGGDEFVVLIEGGRDGARGAQFAHAILATLRAPFRLGGSVGVLNTTGSIGVAIATSEAAAASPVTCEDVLREADLALYRAKDAGRNQLAVFDDSLRADVQERVHVEHHLREALVQESLRLVYQPLVDVTDGRIIGTEVLSRLEHPERAIPPDVFIEVAEDAGLIPVLDAQVLRRALHQHAAWLASGLLPGGYVSVNVSAATLDGVGFGAAVVDLLDELSLPGRALRLELTERTLLSTSDAATANVQLLHARGVVLGLDDFGTGYSALAYLTRLPLSFLKIDRSFVERIGCSQRDDDLIAAIVTLGHAQGLMVVAEGVEEPSQREALANAGCDVAQGWLFGRPVPAEELQTQVEQQAESPKGRPALAV